MARFIIKIEASNIESDEKSFWDKLVPIVKDIVELKASGNELIVVTSDGHFVGKKQDNFQGDFEVEDHRYGIWRDRRLLREKICSVIGQPLLISRYVEIFGRYNHLVAQILLTRADLADQSRYESIRVMTINLLKHGIIPVFSENDVLLAGRFGFGDSDQLACMLAMAFQADKLVILSNIDGLFAKAPVVGSPQLVREVDDLDSILGTLCDEKDEVEKERIRSRIEAARMVTSFGIEMHIMNGTKERILINSFIEGIANGTVFRSHGVKLKQRKGWVALAAQSKGVIVVSTFLAEAINTRKPVSILLIGVEKVTGNFNKNDVVTVKDTDGKVLGRGEVRYSSDELIKLVQKRINGEKMEFFGSEVIHCDYFVIATP